MGIAVATSTITQTDGDTTMEDTIEMSPGEFDAIMSDVQSKKRIAVQAVIDNNNKKMKAQTHPSQRSGWGGMSSQEEMGAPLRWFRERRRRSFQELREQQHQQTNDYGTREYKI